ncbi:MAG: extracellular solute-binding protein [Anaerolineae bacterium]
MVTPYGWRGWLLPLDEVYTDTELDDFVPAAIDASLYQGKLLAPPTSTSTQLLYYNADLFKRAGITPPGQDERWTWEKIAEVAPALTFDDNGDGTPDVWGFIWAQFKTIYQLQPLIEGLGGKVIGDDGLTVRGIIDSDVWVEAMTYYWKVFNEWKVAPQGDVFWPPDIFETQNLAMFVDGPWSIPRLAKANLPFEWGVSRHPKWADGENCIPTGCWHVGVNPNTANREHATQLVHWLTTSHGQEIYWRIGCSDMPALQSILNKFETEAEFQEGAMSYMKVAAAEAKVAPRPRPVTPGYVEYSQILENTFQDIRNGADVREALAKAVDRIEPEMEKYK